MLLVKLIRMRNWILILLATTVLTGWTFSSRTDSSVSAFKELPVMKVNVYMMGRQEVDEEITIKIYENIEYLNDAFEGHISFVFDELFMDPNHAYLPDLYKKFHVQNSEPIVEPVVKYIEKSGGINVFLFDTYCEEGRNDALMGFTPMLSANQQTYASSSPQFDRILMAYQGLEENTTLVHEMGHFFGLKHPWEMTASAKYILGMRNKHDEACNHMSYGDQVEKFTSQQLEEMRRYALKYRSYLMDRIVRVYAKA